MPSQVTKVAIVATKYFAHLNVSKDASALDLSEIKYGLARWNSLTVGRRLTTIHLYGKPSRNIGKVAFVSGDTDYYFGGGATCESSSERIRSLLRLFQQLRHNRFMTFCGNKSLAQISTILVSNYFTSSRSPSRHLTCSEEFVAEIEGYQRVIDGARAVVDNYRPRVAVDPAWPLVAIGEICERVQYGQARLNTEEAGYKTFRMNELVSGRCVDTGEMKYADISIREFAKYRTRRPAISCSIEPTALNTLVVLAFRVSGDYCFASYLHGRLSVAGSAAHPH